MSTKCEIKYVIFDSSLPHLFIKGEHAAMKFLGNITSAGFVIITDGKLTTFGYSHSLNMGPGPDDEMILNHFFGGE
jgi:hypothetical protein